MNLIKSNWFKSFRLKGVHPPRISKAVFEQGLNARIRKLTDKCPPIVATYESVPEEVLGWACRDMGILHYVYVKHDFRREKIAKLLTFNTVAYTHFTPAGEGLMNALQPRPTYNPYLLEIT